MSVISNLLTYSGERGMWAGNTFFDYYIQKFISYSNDLTEVKGIFLLGG